MSGNTDEDHAALAAIMGASQYGDGRLLIERITAYYRDSDRAARTPRAMLYLHLGMLAGLATRLLHEQGE